MQACCCSLVEQPRTEFCPTMQATGSGQQLMDLWRVDRHCESTNFDQHRELSNRRLLWHGTNIAVVAAILKAGLRIMPHACGRVGRGLYLANQQSKSASYVTCGRKGKDLVGVRMTCATCALAATSCHMHSMVLCCLRLLHLQQTSFKTRPFFFTTWANL